MENPNLENESKHLTILSHCYICGAKEKRRGNSFHCWDIEYECGCKIYGAIIDNIIHLDTVCPNRNR